VIGDGKGTSRTGRNGRSGDKSEQEHDGLRVSEISWLELRRNSDQATFGMLDCQPIGSSESEPSTKHSVDRVCLVAEAWVLLY